MPDQKISSNQLREFLEATGQWFERKKTNKICSNITTFNYSPYRFLQYVTSPFGGVR